VCIYYDIKNKTDDHSENIEKIIKLIQENYIFFQEDSYMMINKFYSIHSKVSHLSRFYFTPYKLEECIRNYGIDMNKSYGYFVVINKFTNHLTNFESNELSNFEFDFFNSSIKEKNEYYSNKYIVFTATGYLDLIIGAMFFIYDNLKNLEYLLKVGVVI
jgi:hypothetical protein